jgi:hypothetical protein
MLVRYFTLISAVISFVSAALRHWQLTDLIQLKTSAGPGA